MIIDTSNAHAAPGPSRGYACLRVAFPSIGTHPLEGEIRGWGFAGDSLAFVPLSADPVCAARAPFGGEPFSCLRSCRSAPPRLRTRLPVDSFIWLPAVRGAGAVRPGAGCGARRPTDDGAPGNTLKHGKVVKSGGESWAQSASSVSASPTPLFHRHRLTANSLPTTSDQTRQPAEFKHITKRRKRN